VDTSIGDIAGMPDYKQCLKAGYSPQTIHDIVIADASVPAQPIRSAVEVIFKSPPSLNKKLFMQRLYYPVIALEADWALTLSAGTELCDSILDELCSGLPHVASCFILNKRDEPATTVWPKVKR
jgi:hypothetical protein